MHLISYIFHIMIHVKKHKRNSSRVFSDRTVGNGRVWGDGVGGGGRRRSFLFFFFFFFFNFEF